MGASDPTAAAGASAGDASGSVSPGDRRARALPPVWMRRAVRPMLLACGFAATLSASPATAASNKVRITQLTDVAFGTVANLAADAVQSQSLCLFADTAVNGYNITASGTGPGGAFQLNSGARAMGYEVQWNGSAGQSSGVQLSPNVPLTGQTSTATHQTCGNGPATTASLIIVLRSSALSSAVAGTYSGSLTLLVGPE